MWRFQVLEKENIWVFFLSLLYIGLNIVFSFYGFYYLNLIPLVFILLFVGLRSMDNLLLIIAFLTPLSIPLRYFLPNIPVDASLPAEPLLVILMLLFILKSIKDRAFEIRILYHPVSLAIFLYFLWLIITCITSTLPIISIKFLIARAWFVLPLYFFAILVFSNLENPKKFIWLYVISLMIIIFYTLYNLNTAGWFNKKVAHLVMHPFYNDHTAYGAAIAMFIPPIACYLFISKKNIINRFYISSLLLILIAGVIFSYSRAAWISLVGALVLFLILVLKIKFRILFIFFLVLGGLLFIYKTELFDMMRKNKEVSSNSLEKQVKSISNIASDVSNRERLNRWKSAFRMFAERPVFGWGPGTYMFKYAPFQMSNDRTQISTDFGDWGNAHSEYIGPLAESGVFGTISFLGIIITVILSGIRVYRKTKDKNSRILGLSVLLGLTTYFIHGMLNNFLDTDKLSVPFWGFIAILVALDLKNSRENQSPMISL
jgi:putative inorganic carbon (hco3(-)) transporter